MPVVTLYGAVGTGVIISCDSGISYCNQVGGYLCRQLEFDGVYLPLANDVALKNKELMSPENELRAYFEGPKHNGWGANDGLDDEDADFIDSALQKYHQDKWIKVDRSRLKESCEAWVFVQVYAEDDPVPLQSGFEEYPRLGVLTWSNSD